MTPEVANADIDPRVRSEAERWLVRLLERDASDPERAEFERWLAASSMHASAYREAEQLWAAAERLLHPRHAPARPWRGRLAAALAAAALLAVALGLGAYGWHVFGFHQGVASYSTRVGQRLTLHLEDGSGLLLDTDTSAVVRYGHRLRRVDLLRGRAEFRVQHEAGRPFVVHAGGGTVTAVGTKFQVSFGTDGDVDVVLLNGKVSVAAARSKTTLTSGEGLQFDRTGIVRGAHPVDLSEALGWTHGEVIAHDWRLPQLLATMNRYSDTKLRVGDASLRDVRVTGTFPAGDQQTLIQVLEAGWPIRAEHVSATEVVLLHD